MNKKELSGKTIYIVGSIEKPIINDIIYKMNQNNDIIVVASEEAKHMGLDNISKPNEISKILTYKETYNIELPITRIERRKKRRK